MDEKDIAQERLAKGPVVGSRYRHYKGGEYIVVGYAVDEATLKHLVIYQNAKGILWVRTIEDWSAMVKIEGKTVPRFQLIT